MDKHVKRPKLSRNKSAVVVRIFSGCWLLVETIQSLSVEKSNMKRFIPGGLLIVCTAIISAGCSETPVEVAAVGSSLEIINTHCPIMGNPVDKAETDPAMMKDWNGKKVAFCCPPCLEEWDELSDAEKAEKIANPPAGHGDEGQSHSESPTTPASEATSTPAEKP